MALNPAINQNAASIKFPEIIFGAEPAVLQSVQLNSGFLYQKGSLIGTNMTFTEYFLYDSTDVTQLLFGVLYDDWVNTPAFAASQAPFTFTGNISTNAGNIGNTTTVNFTANTHSSTTIDNISVNTNIIPIGSAVSGPGIPVGATVATIVSSSSITISAAATATATAVSLSATATGVIEGNIVGNNGNDPVLATSVITGISINTAALTIGAQITGTGLPTNATILSILSPTAILIVGNVTAITTGVTLTSYTVAAPEGRLNVATTQNPTTQFLFTSLVGVNSGQTDITNFLASNPNAARKFNRYNGQLAIPVVTFNIIG